MNIVITIILVMVGIFLFGLFLDYILDKLEVTKDSKDETKEVSR